MIALGKALSTRPSSVQLCGFQQSPQSAQLLRGVQSAAAKILAKCFSSLVGANLGAQVFLMFLFVLGFLCKSDIFFLLK
jgi:hypothetical protein